MKVKAVYTATSGVEYVKESHTPQKQKKLSISCKVRILMYLRREAYGLSLRELHTRIIRDTKVFVGYKQLVQYENCLYEFNESQKQAIAEVLGLEVEDLEIIEVY